MNPTEVAAFHCTLPRITDRIIAAHGARAKPSTPYPESVLFDSRLDSLAHNLRGLFDCILISQVPLVHQGEDISQEDNETRCWIRGSGFYSEDTSPSEAQMADFLAQYIDRVKQIHDGQYSLLFHPYFFDQDCFAELKESAPRFCQSILREPLTHIESRPRPSPEAGVHVTSKRGYYHTQTVATYEPRHLADIWDSVRTRVRDAGVSMDSDVMRCMEAQHRLLHSFLCSHIYVETDTAPRVSAFYACPTSLLTKFDDNRGYRVASGIAGMFWVVFVTKHGAWRTRKEKKAAESFVRTTWLLLISEHLNKKHEADLQRGKLDYFSAASHDLKNVLPAIAPGTAPEALVLIREYIEELTLQSKLAHETEPICQDRQEDIAIVCQKAMEKAGAIETVIEMSKVGRGLESAREVTAKIARRKEWLSKSVSISTDSHQQSLPLNATQSKALFLALIAALRNAVRHTLSNQFEGTIAIECSSSKISIKNTIRVRVPSSRKQGKPDGTLGSMRSYARLYGGNPREVRLDMIRSDPVENSNHFIETWQATLPLPVDTL